MELLFTQQETVQPQDVTPYGNLKLSRLLEYVQQIAGAHCDAAGLSWAAVSNRGLFWAVLRHRIQIERLPRQGETLTLETWPLPTTRTAYPRAVRCLNSQGEVLFQVMSFWVLMDIHTRAMVLPGKNGIDVPGLCRGIEIPTPGTLVPGVHTQQMLWSVTSRDLDVNGHVNNARYLDHTAPLAEQFFPEQTPKQVSVCYFSEVLPQDAVTLQWGQDGTSFQVDAFRWGTDEHQKPDRVFAVRMDYE